MDPHDEWRPIFISLADSIADDILAGIYPEESQVPSTNQLAVHYRINPATAGKALNRLVESGVLYKKRGLGIFVAAGAPQTLRAERQARFVDDYVQPLLLEADRLSLTVDDVVAMITKERS